MGSIHPGIIEELVRKHYGMQVSAELLKGYDEINLRLIDEKGIKYVLKLSDDESQTTFIRAQLEVLAHLQESGLRHHFQRCIQALNGETLLEITVLGQVFSLRMLSYLEGDFWLDTPQKSPALYESLGDFLGRMDRQLEGYYIDAARRECEWDLNQVTHVADYLDYFEDQQIKRLVHYFLLQYLTEVQPFLGQLRKSVIHNDANDHNLLVDQNRITGLIDFGDMVYSHTVNNLAIACTYAMLSADDPLACATLVVKGYHRAFALSQQEVSLLYYLIGARLCISLAQSARNRAHSHPNPYRFLSEKPARELLQKLIEINPLKAHGAFRQACGFSAADASALTDSLLKRRFRVLGHNLSLSYKDPLQIERGALQYLYDTRGNTYVDCVNNVSHLGHCHPRLVQEMQGQIARLNTNTRYLHPTVVEYAEAILKTLPDKFSRCYFVNSGSEANDLAIRMARRHTGRDDVIVLDHAYHGTTSLALGMSPYKYDGPGGFSPPAWVHKAQSPDLYRGPFTYDMPDAGKRYARDVECIINALASEGNAPAAFICESLLGVGGQMPLPEGYLREVYRIIRAAGGLCIADEVQVGFGRVGEAFWGFALQEVEPDIVVLGKPIGNGHPLAAVVITEEIAQSFDTGMEYFNTYGGNPVSMQAGLTVLRIIEQEKLQAHALELGQWLLAGLNELKEKHALIGDVRGKGLFIGIELVRDRQSKAPAVPEIFLIVEKMKQRGFLLSTDGPLNNVLKFKPPLVFSKANAEAMLARLDEVLCRPELYTPESHT